MSTPLANPRRTKIVAWPERRPAEQDAERPAEAEAREGAAH
ncbi:MULTISPECIES: hypothetical protein [Actinomadura]|nr:MULTISPECIES: hypothetical protein [Actinomadura]